MKKIVMAFAIALTFGCSTDGGDDDDQTPVSSSGGNGNSSSSVSNATDGQVYLNDDSKYTGNASVVIFDFASGYTLSVGTIKDGKIELKLPSSVDDKYLGEFPADFCDLFGNDGINAICEVTAYTLANAKLLFAEFKAVIPDKGLCDISLEFKKNDVMYRVDYIYTSKAGQAIASIEYFHENESGMLSYDWNLAAGWNTAYSKDSNLSNEVSDYEFSTNKSTLEGNAPKWVLDGNAYHCMSLD